MERRAREVAGETPVTLIVHDIKFVNHEIRIGQYFFADIVNEGVLLFDSRRAHARLAKPKALNAPERLALAERNFRNWFDSASGFWRGCRYYASMDLLKHAAFLLHQATERYYHAALLVFTGYKQRTHDIEALGKLAGEQHALLHDVLPKTDPEDKRLFDLLKKGYIDARYSMSYRITVDELSILQERVLLLAAHVRAACIEKMATFCGAEAVSPNLPVPPKLGEALLSNLPPPPSEAKDFARWAQGLVELSEQRAREERREGRQEGEVKGVREGILMVLTTRGIPVSAEVEHQIASCSDPALLSLWLKRAVTASRAEDVLAPAPGS
jgi:HEPN domain-containing protein